MNPSNNKSLANDRQPWTTPALKSVGKIADVLKGGGGKLSTVGGDPGENRKQTGGGA